MDVGLRFYAELVVSVAATSGSVLYENSNADLPSAERDDAPDGIVGRDPHGHSVAGNHFDAETAHPAAQLCENLVTLVTVHAVQPAAVNRHNSALHVDQIILAQVMPFPIKDCATFWSGCAN
jgi:hypothetical protein